MSEKPKTHNKSIILTAIVATFMMLIFGTIHRTLNARLVSDEGLSSMSPDCLEIIPLQIGGWSGQDEPLSDSIIEATDTDAHINRRYFRYNLLDQVSLYIAAGKRARDLMPHRPEVCYIGAGWTRLSSDSTELLLDDGKVLPCNIFQFSKGALSTENIIVLDYYIVDGQFYRDVSQLRSKIWKGSGAVGYVAQIQIVAVIASNQKEDTAVQMVSDFAGESACLIFDVLESVAGKEEQDTEYITYEESSKNIDGD